MTNFDDDFRDWVLSLSKNELVEAMSFDFMRSSDDSTHSVDYDILLEMVVEMSPPESPVHPRGMGVKKRMSKFGPQLDYEHGKEKLRVSNPRIFQWSRRQSYQSRMRKGKPQPKFDVIARKKCSPWLNLEDCTEEQREADNRIINGTWINFKGHLDHHQTNSVVFCDTEYESSSESIIRMLQVASRGLFLNSTMSAHSTSDATIPFSTNWLHPTERFFSLSFYLASRYQISLWHSFRSQTTCKTNEKQPTNDHELLKVAIPAAIRDGLREVLKEEVQQLIHLRDSIAWDLVGGDKSSLHTTMGNPPHDWPSVYKSLVRIPLIHVHKRQNQLKLRILRCLQHTMVQEMEKKLLMETVVPPPVGSKAKKKK